MSILRNHVWAGLLLVVGFYTIVAAGLGWFSQLPGDLGDARFNMFMLEHFFRFVTGQTPSFWDAPIFYPYPMATAFTANHLGTAPVYAAVRLIGSDRETTFQLWYLAGYLTNFLAAYYVLIRSRFGNAAAALGAFIFAFGLPALAQQNHVQLLWRAGVPLASWWMWRFTQFGHPRLLFLAALAAVWQLYAEIYMGVMLAMLLVALLVAGGFTQPGGRRWIGIYWRGIAARLVARRAWPWVAGIVLLAVAAVMLLLPYAEVAHRYGFQREANEVRLMLPQWRSYLVSDQSLIWRDISAHIQGLPLRWEHQLFLGVGPLVLIALSFFLRPLAPAHRLVRTNRIALVMLGVFTIHLQNTSIYEIMLAVPGLSAIRGVTRIIEVMLWPIAVLAAASATRLLAMPRPWAPMLAYALAALTLFESATSLQFRVSKQEAQSRTASLKQTITAARLPDGRPPILFVASKPAEAPLLAELDAMLASQDLGWPTLNGYSGNAPPGYAFTTRCGDAEKRLRSFALSQFAAPSTSPEELITRVLPVGFSDCPSR